MSSPKFNVTVERIDPESKLLSNNAAVTVLTRRYSNISVSLFACKPPLTSFRLNEEKERGAIHPGSQQFNLLSWNAHSN
jgi:hypothetical protein